MERLRLYKESIFGDGWSYSDFEIIHLQIRIPYKCFGKRKYHWEKIFWINVYKIPDEYLQNKSKLKTFMWLKYQENRKGLRRKRLIERL